MWCNCFSFLWFTAFKYIRRAIKWMNESAVLGIERFCPSPSSNFWTENRRDIKFYYKCGYWVKYHISLKKRYSANDKMQVTLSNTIGKINFRPKMTHFFNDVKGGWICFFRTDHKHAWVKMMTSHSAGPKFFIHFSPEKACRAKSRKFRSTKLKLNGRWSRRAPIALGDFWKFVTKITHFRHISVKI